LTPSEQAPRIYPNLIGGVTEALTETFSSLTPADRVLEKHFKQRREWGSRDRAFVAHTFYEVIRWYRLLYEVLGHEPQQEEDWQDLIGVWMSLQGRKDVSLVSRRLPPQAELLKRAEALSAQRAIRESLPDWLDALASGELGAAWDEALPALNQPAPLILRANRLKITPEELAERLKAEEIEAEALAQDALRVPEKRNLFRSEAFQQGLFEVQDYASQQVARMLDVAPGMRVVDACAGAGGKTLHLAALMQNKGRILAMDREDYKLEELRRRARRAGAHIVETRTIASSKTVKRLAESADRVLLDAPCSGLGVLRRNPDAKWKLSAEFLDRVRQWQRDILFQYSRMCKPGGKLVYATCSLLPSENEAQVAAFLEHSAGAFTLREEQRIWPQEGYDGFYIALMERS
jgi:16S rRNA (cytosine967-C5)-methyltransferase